MAVLRFPSLFLLLCFTCSLALCRAETITSIFDNNFLLSGDQDHFSTSSDGQEWYLSLDNTTGCAFETKERYMFGWFSMKLKLVGGDCAGVVTAYYMCSHRDAAPDRDELDFEFLGNKTGEPYILQTNIYHNGVGDREMRHNLWFDPTQDYHSYSILWNSHQIVFFVDLVPIRVYKNNGKPNSYFPDKKPMYLFSSIWDAEDWATRGGLDKTNWTYAPFKSSYKDFTADGCKWEDPAPDCASTTTEHWWDQSPAWGLSDSQKLDYDWCSRNFEGYNYCKDTARYDTLPEECNM